MKICFIINPISGKKTAEVGALTDCLRHTFPNATIHLTQRAGHATQLAQQAVSQQFDAVVAAGGDGTINETARALVGTQTALGILPRGSGNGFAREIGMHLSFQKATQQLRQVHPVWCDVGRANGEVFLNVAGVGLEADIAWQFMQYGQTNRKRGKWPYFKLGVKTVFSYQPASLHINADGTTLQAAPLTLVFANGRQYGSNFKIAPKASLTDGLLDMVSVHHAPKWKLALAVPGFFTDTWRPFGITQTAQIKQATIQRAGVFAYHIDGEPRQASGPLNIEIAPHALRVLFPEK